MLMIELLFAVLFSVTAPTVSDLLPIIIIFALILAAAGLTRGANLFAMFGVGTLLGVSGRISGGGAGKGFGSAKSRTVMRRKIQDSSKSVGGVLKKNMLKGLTGGAAKASASRAAGRSSMIQNANYLKRVLETHKGGAAATAAKAYNAPPSTARFVTTAVSGNVALMGRKIMVRDKSGNFVVARGNARTIARAQLAAEKAKGSSGSIPQLSKAQLAKEKAGKAVETTEWHKTRLAQLYHKSAAEKLNTGAVSPATIKAIKETERAFAGQPRHWHMIPILRIPVPDHAVAGLETQHTSAQRSHHKAEHEAAKEFWKANYASMPKSARLALDREISNLKKSDAIAIAERRKAEAATPPPPPPPGNNAPSTFRYETPFKNKFAKDEKTKELHTMLDKDLQQRLEKAATHPLFSNKDSWYHDALWKHTMKVQEHRFKRDGDWDKLTQFRHPEVAKDAKLEAEREAKHEKKQIEEEEKKFYEQQKSKKQKKLEAEAESLKKKAEDAAHLNRKP